MHPSNGADAHLTPGLVFEMLQAHQRTAALKAAIDLDVFRAVGDGPGDAYTLSELTSMYGQAGFGSVTAHPIPMSPHTIVMGRA